jgi:hypothetical protein
VNNDFPIIFVIYKWIKTAPFGSERVYCTAIISEKNAFVFTVFQETLSSSFHYKIFELVSLYHNSIYIKTRERHTSLYATFDTIVNRAWNATAQEMFLSFIIIFRIEFFAFQEKRLLKCLLFLSFAREWGYLCSNSELPDLIRDHCN